MCTFPGLVESRTRHGDRSSRIGDLTRLNVREQSSRRGDIVTDTSSWAFNEGAALGVGLCTAFGFPGAVLTIPCDNKDISVFHAH
jgi:hypothetical protein